jgi:2-polyprenyl-3-methyl-5-hydroxy-6-metoxy-1,4-benzoquinol methylase
MLTTKNGIYCTDSFWDNVWSRSYVNYEKHHQLFWKLIRDNARGKVLDLGCGSGSCWKGIPVGIQYQELTGVDFSYQACVEFCHNNPGAKAVNDTVENFKWGIYDTVVLSGVINYYHDLTGIIRTLTDNTTKGSVIIITINVIKDFEDRIWNEELISRTFGNLGKLHVDFYDKIGYFIIIEVL